VLQGHVASDHDCLAILSGPGRSGGDEPGFEAIGGWVHKRRALNTRLSSGTSAGTFAVSAGPYRNYQAEAVTKNEPATYFVPIQKRGWKIYPHVSNIRSREFLPSRGSGPPLRWGWVFLERRRILSGIQFTTHLIEFFVVETKRFVGSFSNVILTRQTCGQRSSRAAESKRRAPGNYFCEWICYMFLISKCRGDWDLGLCTFWVLAKRESLRNGAFRKKTCFARRKNRNMALRSGSLFASTQKVHRFL